MNSGKDLERLVAYIEQRMLSEGWSVETNVRVRNKEGAQIGEFDVSVRGRVGSTDIFWLIECRDRPSKGPAPTEWIQQLLGKRSQFLCNKVTAVSTTGFSPGATELAEKEGIELRVVSAISPEAFEGWLTVKGLSFTELRSEFQDAHVALCDEATDEVKAEIVQLFSEIGNDGRILRSTKTGQICTFAEAFMGMCRTLNLFDGLNEHGSTKHVDQSVRYTNDEDRFCIDTTYGSVEVLAIRFIGNLYSFEKMISDPMATEYRVVGAEQPISQRVKFDPIQTSAGLVQLEMHRLSDSGKTVISVGVEPPSSHR